MKMYIKTIIEKSFESIMEIYMKITKPKEKTRIPGSINFALIV